MADETLPSTPLFAQTPQAAPVVVLTKVAPSLNPANLTDLELLFTAGPKGAIVTKIDGLPCGVTTATAVHLFLAASAAGAVPKFKGSFAVAGFNNTIGTVAPEASYAKVSESRPMRLGPGEKLYGALGSNQVNGIAVPVEGSHF